MYRTLYFLLYHFILYISCMLAVLEGRLGASRSWTNRKSRSPIIHIGTANSWSCRKLLLGECRKCWLWLRSVVWFWEATRESLGWNFVNDRRGSREGTDFIKCGLCCSSLYQVSVVRLFCTKLKHRNDLDCIWVFFEVIRLSLWKFLYRKL